MDVQRAQEAKKLTIPHKKMITDLLDTNIMLGCRSSPLVLKAKIMSLFEDPTQEKA